MQPAMFQGAISGFYRIMKYSWIVARVHIREKMRGNCMQCGIRNTHFMCNDADMEPSAVDHGRFAVEGSPQTTLMASSHQSQRPKGCTDGVGLWLKGEEELG